ncbi:hypothetical protein B0H11DRAFT_2349020, partial [Mycena galericulata]
ASKFLLPARKNCRLARRRSSGHRPIFNLWCLFSVTSSTRLQIETLFHLMGLLRLRFGAGWHGKRGHTFKKENRTIPHAARIRALCEPEPEACLTKLQATSLHGVASLPDRRRLAFGVRASCLLLSLNFRPHHYYQWLKATSYNANQRRSAHVRVALAFAFPPTGFLSTVHRRSPSSRISRYAYAPPLRAILTPCSLLMFHAARAPMQPPSSLRTPPFWDACPPSRALMPTSESELAQSCPFLCASLIVQFNATGHTTQPPSRPAVRTPHDRFHPISWFIHLSLYTEYSRFLYSLPQNSQILFHPKVLVNPSTLGFPSQFATARLPSLSPSHLITLPSPSNLRPSTKPARPGHPIRLAPTLYPSSPSSAIQSALRERPNCPGFNISAGLVSCRNSRRRRQRLRSDANFNRTSTIPSPPTHRLAYFNYILPHIPATHGSNRRPSSQTPSPAQSKKTLQKKTLPLPSASGNKQTQRQRQSEEAERTPMGRGGFRNERINGAEEADRTPTEDSAKEWMASAAAAPIFPSVPGLFLLPFIFACNAMNSKERMDSTNSRDASHSHLSLRLVPRGDEDDFRAQPSRDGTRTRADSGRDASSGSGRGLKNVGERTGGYTGRMYGENVRERTGRPSYPPHLRMMTLVKAPARYRYRYE